MKSTTGYEPAGCYKMHHQKEYFKIKKSAHKGNKNIKGI